MKRSGPPQAGPRGDRDGTWEPIDVLCFTRHVARPMWLPVATADVVAVEARKQQHLTAAVEDSILHEIATEQEVVSLTADG